MPVNCNLPARIWPRRSSGAQNPLRVGDGGGVGSIIGKEGELVVLKGPVKASRTGIKVYKVRSGNGIGLQWFERPMGNPVEMSGIE